MDEQKLENRLMKLEEYVFYRGTQKTFDATM